MTTYRVGAHLRASRFGYWHHGIYAGNYRVIHFAGEKTNKLDAQVRCDSIDVFANGDRVEEVDYSHCNSPEKTIQIAESFLYQKNYDLFDNNCEHFCSYCKTNQKRSTQIENVDNGFKTGVAGGIGGAVTIGAIAAAGTAAGVKTVAGVTSGLAAAAGSLATGIALTAAIPGGVTAIAANALIDSNDPSLPKREREAREAAKVGATVGAVGGTVAAVAAVSAAGTTAGIGTVAGVTSGLAAVGGSLTGGLIVTAAAPVAAAATLGWLVYKFTR